MKANYELTFLKEKPTFPFYEVNQIHSSRVVSLKEVKNSPNLIDADGIFWEKEELQNGESVGIKTADCLSVFIESDTYFYLIHAGWRGVHKNIFSTVNNPLSIKILPSIKKCCFEVTHEFRNTFSNNKNFGNKDGKLFFDLIGQTISQISQRFPLVTFDIDPRCTCCSKENFHSFRRDKTALRNYTLITNK